ncbi:DUF2027 domain-containing protein [Bacteroidota bacterium]
MLRIGEKVKYLNDVGEATILAFLNAKMALVEDEYGLQHQHPINQLVPATRDRLPTKNTPPKAKTIVNQPVKKAATVIQSKKPLPELSLAFVSATNKPETSDLDFLFANNTTYNVMVNVAIKEHGEWYSLFHGEVKAKEIKAIQTLRRQDLGTVSNLNVDLLFFKSVGYEPRTPISTNIKIKATRFVKSGNYIEYEKLNKPAIVIPIEQEKATFKTAIAAETSLKKAKSIAKSSLPIFEEEVDLHLDKILGHEPTNVTDHEKFLTQMRHFERKLNHALTHNYAEITFIHGLGTGRLKDAIRTELKEYGLSYADGPFHKYGVGATVVQLH